MFITINIKYLMNIIWQKNDRPNNKGALTSQKWLHRIAFQDGTNTLIRGREPPVRLCVTGCQSGAGDVCCLSVVLIFGDISKLNRVWTENRSCWVSTWQCIPLYACHPTTNGWVDRWIQRTAQVWCNGADPHFCCIRCYYFIYIHMYKFIHIFSLLHKTSVETIALHVWIQMFLFGAMISSLHALMFCYV